MEAVRAALGVDKLTLIGVSYGTFLAQAYAARYPTHVERVLLDSVLDVSGWDPFYLDTFAAVPRVLRAVCRGSCSDFTDDPVNDLGALVTRLERGKLRGKVTLPNGHRRRYGLTRQELLFTLVAGDLDELGRAQFPGAVLSALGGDTAPILRLERHAVYTESAGSAREFSAGSTRPTPARRSRSRGRASRPSPSATGRSPRRSIGSPSRTSTRSTAPRPRATTSCACAAAGPRRRRRPTPLRQPARCRTSRC